MAGQVTWEGFRQWQELPAIYARADALCLPTRHDGWAMVIPEALAAGLPVITTKDAGAALELVTHGVNGWLLPGSAAGMIEGALRHLAKLPAEELAQASAAARQSVNDHTLEEGRRWFIAAARKAMDAFHCRLHEEERAAPHLLITGTYAPDRLRSMKRYVDLVESVSRMFSGSVERIEVPVLFAGVALGSRTAAKTAWLCGQIFTVSILPAPPRIEPCSSGGGMRGACHRSRAGAADPMAVWFPRDRYGA